MHKEIFTEIYNKNSWQSNESFSGPGSSYNRTHNLRKELVKLIKKYNITNVVDIPCGDLNWIKSILSSIPNYVGIDVVEDLIKNNKKNFPNLNFYTDDIITSNLLNCDLLIVRDLLFHFSQENVKKAINNIKKNNTKYLLTSEIEDNTHINKNIRDGTWYPIALQNSPYNFPQPIIKIKEDAPNKFISLWLVKDLPNFNI